MMYRYLVNPIFRLGRVNSRLFSTNQSANLNILNYNSNENNNNLMNRYFHTNKQTLSKRTRFSERMPKVYEYPKVRRDESIVENFFGVDIKDPYRWLEDPDSEETQAFVDQQNKLTNSFLENCKYRSKIRERLTEFWNYPKYGCFSKRGDFFYFFKNSGLQNQSVLYQRKTLESTEDVEFLDPNKFAADGTTSLQQGQFSEDGKLYAYICCEKGSDWGKIRVRSVETGADLDDTLENVKFSCLSWTHDNKGFFYNQYPSYKADGTSVEKNEFQIVCYHRIGTKQADDLVVARFPDDPNWMGHVEVSDCGDYLIMSISKSCDPVNQLWYFDIKKADYVVSENLPFVKLVDNFDDQYQYVTNEGSLFVFKTNQNAPRYKLISIDLNNAEKPPKWNDFVPEKDDVLQSVSCVNKDKLLLNYMHDCKDELYLYDLNTGKEIKKFQIEIGSILQISGTKKNDFFFFKFASFTTPGDIFYYKFDANATEADLMQKEPELYIRSEFKGLDLSEFKTEQVFFTSKDGTKVPMFLVCKKTLQKSQDNPLLMYGYGGFNISLTPTFSVVRLIWLKHFNGIYANVNLRGGGEYGEDWYNAGRLLNKQNVFDDFISAAEYLIENKYTNKERIGINGGSNGGLLVTACINQRPDLFHTAIADVSVTDMLRFHKFTIGSYWVSDYGSSENEEQFKYMIKYSPLHTINAERQYPYVLLVTADHDDRVVPSHSYKYIAELQYQNKGHERPYLIRIETKAGHGAGKPTSKIIEEFADKYAYLVETMNLDWKDE